MAEKKKIEDLTEEEKAAIWVDYVKSEVMAYLDFFLPACKTGNIGIRYEHPVVKKTQSPPSIKYDETKATGFTINLVFDFEEALDIPQDIKE